MGWSIGYDDNWQRDIGYGVPAYCDEPGCGAEIDRGLSYVCCSEEPYGGDNGCGLYFCGKHQKTKYPLDVDGEEDDSEDPICGHGDGYVATADHPDWISHKLTDESWAEWRAENPTEVEKLLLAAPTKETKDQ